MGLITKLKRVSKRLSQDLYRARIHKVPSVVRSVRERSLTYLSEDALCNLHEHVIRIEKHQIQGDFIEAGCALGGSAIVIASAKLEDRRFDIYDVFARIPAPSSQDGPDVHSRYETITSGNSKGIGGERYYGYNDNLLESVQDNFRLLGLSPAENDIHFVKGLLQDTLHPENDVAFAHIDCDWYESVKTCLQRIVPRLVCGGVIIVDDYFTWSGCRKAVDEFFADKLDDFEFQQNPRLSISRRCF